VFGPGGKLIGSLAIVGTFPQDLATRYGADVAAAAKKFSELIGSGPRVPAPHSTAARVEGSDELGPK